MSRLFNTFKDENFSFKTFISEIVLEYYTYIEEIKKLSVEYSDLKSIVLLFLFSLFILFLWILFNKEIRNERYNFIIS